MGKGLLVNLINYHIRWFKTQHVLIASERSQRRLAKEVLGKDNVVSEMGAFSFPTDKGEEEIREVPFVYVPNLIMKIADVVASYER